MEMPFISGNWSGLRDQRLDTWSEVNLPTGHWPWVYWQIHTGVVQTKKMLEQSSQSPDLNLILRQKLITNGVHSIRHTIETYPLKLAIIADKVGSTKSWPRGNSGSLCSRYNQWDSASASCPPDQFIALHLHIFHAWICWLYVVCYLCSILANLRTMLWHLIAGASSILSFYVSFNVQV